MKMITGATMIGGVCVMGLLASGSALVPLANPITHNDKGLNKGQLSASAVPPSLPVKKSGRHSIHTSNISVVWRSSSTGAMMQRTLSDKDVIRLKKLIKMGHTQEQALLSLSGTIEVSEPRDHHMR